MQFELELAESYLQPVTGHQLVASYDHSIGDSVQFYTEQKGDINV